MPIDRQTTGTPARIAGHPRTGLRSGDSHSDDERRHQRGTRFVVRFEPERVRGRFLARPEPCGWILRRGVAPAFHLGWDARDQSRCRLSKWPRAAAPLTPAGWWAIVAVPLEIGGALVSTWLMRQRRHAEDDPLASLIIGSKKTANEELALAA